MKSWLKKFAVAAALGCAVIMPSQADAASIVVPDTIYEWVQSSSRMNYFFNKQENPSVTHTRDSPFCSGQRFVNA